MTINIANVDVTTDNFSAWIAKHNLMAEAFRHSAITVSNASISYSTGNAAVNGNFTSDLLVANSALRGGNNSQTNTLVITSNVNISNTLSVQQIKVQNSTVNVIITVPTAAQQSNVSTFLHANGSWIYINYDTFPGTANNALHLDGVIAEEYVNISDNFMLGGDITFEANVILSGAVIANGISGTTGQLLASNGAGGMYYVSVAGLELPGANSELVFNDSGDFGSDQRYYYIRADNKVVWGNTTVNTAINENGLYVGNSTANAALTRNQLIIGPTVVNSIMVTTGPGGLIANASHVTVGANVVINTTSLFMGNSTVNTYHGLDSITLSNSTYSSVLTHNRIAFGNTTANVSANSTLLQIANSTATANLNPLSLTIGSSVVNSIAVAAGANAILGTTGLFVGNSTVNAVINSTSLAFGNSSSNTKISLPTAVERNGGNYFLNANGSWVAMFGKTMIPFNAYSMIKRSTNGATLGSVETGNFNMIVTYDFNASTNDHVQFHLPMPSSWNEGTVSYKVIWSHANTTTNFGTVWELAGVAFGNGESSNAAFGTGVQVSDTGGSNLAFYTTDESAAVTVAGSPAAGELVLFQLKRVPGNASDTCAVAAKVHAVELFVTVDTQVDA